ncbi:hypothetical protein LIER_40998 [Lithospermum erythrorhizon]|uniref:DUF4371 domain-containing protein n=1 Tax=Lithospermum erythrorhizon TaxID=34254 RepID=A0AAV3R708_LITER
MKYVIDLKNSSQHIDKVINKYTRQEIAENFLRLQASIDRVRILTDQGLPLRGHNEKENSLRRVHESVDNSNNEQMVGVLRYVNQVGFIQERILDLIYVRNTKAETVKDVIFFLLNEHELRVNNIRGQDYDGASIMSGRFNGLRALISNECRFSYRVYCFAHQFQLTLIAVAREATFSGGHFRTLLRVYENCSHQLVLHWRIYMMDGNNFSARGCEGAYKTVTSFEFVFVLHMMKEILETSHDLCQLLQQKSQYRLNTMDLLRSTKVQIQLLKDVGWEQFIEKVKLFC